MYCARCYSLSGSDPVDLTRLAGRSMSANVLMGSCLCGAVTYQVQTPYIRFVHCYCSRCRKATGSSHATNLFVSPDRFSWISGQELVVRFDLPSAASFATTFCKICGGPLPHHTRSGREVVVPAGSLDDEPDLKPQFNIFWQSRASWACAGGDLPHNAEYAENWR